MYISCWPVLDPRYFLAPEESTRAPFPLSAARAKYFYLARNAIYHLVRRLALKDGETILMPDYHSGNEVAAVRAAGVRPRYYPIRRDLRPDFETLERLCDSRCRALYVIHYIGWPQPIRELARFCRERNLLLIEDCALSMLSDAGGRPLGTFGDYAIYCLYKTLPVPNGGLLVQNNAGRETVGELPLARCGCLSVAGQSLELVLEWLRGSFETAGGCLSGVKQAGGRLLSHCRLRRVPVGDIGFDIAHADLAMSSICRRLLPRLDYELIRLRRRANYLMLHNRLAGRATLVFDGLQRGVCPLFFPILVRDKHEAVRALRGRGIGAIEFWNDSGPDTRQAETPDVRFLRRHLIELPIHQNVTPGQVDWIADQVLRLKLHL